MPNATLNQTISIAGIVLSDVSTRTASGQISHNITTTAGVSGQSDSFDSAGVTGTVDTLDSGHGIAGADRVAIAKASAESDGALTARYDVEVDSATATSFAFVDDSATGGDVLQLADNVALYVTELNDEINTDFAGSDVLAFAIACTQNCWVQFQTEAGAKIADFILKANEGYAWFKNKGVTNPLTGQTVGKVKIGTLSTTAGTFQLGVLYDSDV